MLRARLILGLLLCLRSLLSCLLLRLLFRHSLMATSGHGSDRCPNGCTFASITGNSAYQRASGSPSGSPFYGPALTYIVLSLLCGLLLGSLLLLRTGSGRRRSLRIDPGILASRTIAFGFVFQLLVGILFVLRISKHSDALCGRPGRAGGARLARLRESG